MFFYCPQLLNHLKTRGDNESLKTVVAYEWEEQTVLVYYQPPDFQSVKKPKRGPLEIENFFVEGDLRKVLEGVTSLLKPSSGFLIKKKLKFQIWW